MYVSASIKSFFFNINKIIKSPKDLIHIDYMDDFDLIELIKKLVKKGEKFDLHIISKNYLNILNELKKNNLLSKPKFIFVQIEELKSSLDKKIFEIDNVYPAIKISSNLKLLNNTSAKKVC